MNMKIVLAAGAGLLLLTSGNARAGQAAAQRPVLMRNPAGTQDYTTPTAVAGELARGIVSAVFGVAAPESSMARGQVQAAREAGAAAVRAGDDYYSSRSQPATLPGWDSIVYGWTKPGPPLGVNLGAASAAYAAGEANNYRAIVDGVAAGPVYNPAEDVDVMAGFGWGIE